MLFLTLITVANFLLAAFFFVACFFSDSTLELAANMTIVLINGIAIYSNLRTILGVKRLYALHQKKGITIVNSMLTRIKMIWFCITSSHIIFVKSNQSATKGNVIFLGTRSDQDMTRAINILKRTWDEMPYIGEEDHADKAIAELKQKSLGPNP